MEFISDFRDPGFEILKCGKSLNMFCSPNNISSSSNYQSNSKMTRPKKPSILQNMHHTLVKFEGQSREILHRHQLRLGYANTVSVVNYQNHLTELV